MNTASSQRCGKGAASVSAADKLYSSPPCRGLNAPIGLRVIEGREAFERLRRAGLHVSIDDFGTGHSSLAALRRLPAAELKIARAFVTDLASGEPALSIVRAVVQMAHSLQLRGRR